jgi:hypothetical protein
VSKRLRKQLSIGADRRQCVDESPYVPGQIPLILTIQDVGGSQPASFNLCPGVQQ